MTASLEGITTTTATLEDRYRLRQQKIGLSKLYATRCARKHQILNSKS